MKRLACGVAAACALAAAGGSIDACVYIDHGHVFAAAQTGNIVLMAIQAASGRLVLAARHLPSVIAFCAGVVASRLVASGLRLTRIVDSRTPRLAFVALAFLALALADRGLSDGAVTASVAFAAAFQISSYSRLEGWSFNTAMTTGNLWHAVSAATDAWTSRTGKDDLRKAAALGLLVLSFAFGALAGGWAATRWRDEALLLTSALAGCAVILLIGVGEPAAMT
jgi:uncharacterized membrane protein YoaK (UPF0700 family)